MRFLKTVGWLLNRAAAALAGAILTGVLSGLGISTVLAITCIGRTCEDAFGFPVYYSFEGALGALVLGFLPGFFALTITPARFHPWRALPILAVASAPGFGLFIVFYMVATLRVHVLPDSIALFYLLLVLFPTATGLIAAFNIKRMRFLAPR